jgi:hypothetical protein
MSYAIICFGQTGQTGQIGQALAKAFARKGIEVAVATTREPGSFACGGCDRTWDHSHNTGPSHRGGHRLSSRAFRGPRGYCKGPSQLEVQDHHRCDQCPRRIP